MVGNVRHVGNGAPMFVISTRVFAGALLCLIVSVAGQASDLKTDFEKAYRRAAFAAELKYVEGMLSNRAEDYELYTPGGNLLDLSIERTRFQSLMEPATRVQFETKILRCDPLGNDKAICYVEQFLRVESTDKTGQLETAVVHTWSKDLWVATPRGWRIQKSKVIRQEYGKSEGLPDAYLRPTNFDVKYKAQK